MTMFHQFRQHLVRSSSLLACCWLPLLLLSREPANAFSAVSTTTSATDTGVPPTTSASSSSSSTITAATIRDNIAAVAPDGEVKDETTASRLIRQEYRVTSHAIASQFSPTEFRPLSSLSNRHIQTISGVYLRNNDACKYVEKKTESSSSLPSFFGGGLVDLLLQVGAKILLTPLTKKEEKDHTDAAVTTTATTTTTRNQEISVLLNPDREGFYDERQRFETPDGDFFDVDFKYQHTSRTQNNGDNDDDDGDDDGSTSRQRRRQQRPSSKGMVIMLHGLQSNSRSSLSVDMALAYSDQGFDVACMNFRGCSGEMNRKMGGYHLGFTDDLKQFLEHLRKQRKETTGSPSSSPTSSSSEDDSADSTTMDGSSSVVPPPPPPPLFLSGFSLGSNVVLKALGELGEQAHHRYHIYGAAACGAPFDQERNVGFVQAAGFNRLVYMGFLLRSLKERSLRQMKLFRGSDEWRKVNYETVANAGTIADIENAVLAPLYGFDDHVDYYRKTSCLQFLDDIAVPTLIVNAADDPFFDPGFFPWDKSSDNNDKTSPIRMVRTEHGGHLGFMFHQHPEEEEEDKKQNNPKERASWMPSELARFLECAYENKEQLDDISTALREIRGVISLR